MSQKYILMGSDGPDAFYDTDIHTTIPSGAYEITMGVAG